MPDSEQLKPRIVLELLDDGSVAIEQWINGSRKRTVITALRAFDVMDALEAQKHYLENSEARRLTAQVEAEKKLHRDVWYRAAATHGEGFANRYINGGNAGPNGTATKSQPKGLVVTSDLL